MYINMITVVEFVRVSARNGKFRYHSTRIHQFWPLKWCRNLVEPISFFEIFKLTCLGAIFFGHRQFKNSWMVESSDPGSNPGGRSIFFLHF